MLNYIASLMSGSQYGGIAQLGERLNGIQEVSGSIPLISTKNTTDTGRETRVFCILDGGVRGETPRFQTRFSLLCGF